MTTFGSFPSVAAPFSPPFPVAYKAAAVLYRSRASRRMEKSSSAVQEVAETRRAGRSGSKEAPEDSDLVNRVAGSAEGVKGESDASEAKTSSREKSWAERNESELE